jgi:hypothetical protein
LFVINFRNVYVNFAAVIFLFPSLSAIAATKKEGQVLVTIELAKASGVSRESSLSVSFPKSCGLCQLDSDPAYAKQNKRVAVLAVLLPRSTAVPVHVVIAANTVRRVLLEGQELPFTQDENGIGFTVPPQAVDRVNSGEFQTHIFWPGIDLRFEHGDPERRDGKYQSGAWPAVQLKSAHTLEFAQLLAIRMLGLDSQVVDRNIGSLDLMGFDTDFPHGHEDYPPHMHMILWWPTPTGAGSLIAHYYITPQGLLDHTEVIPLRTVGLVATRIERGVSYTDTDYTGERAYSHTITDKGWLQVAEVNGGSCLISPLGHGFDSGAAVECAGYSRRTVQVEDDIEKGKITVLNDGMRKTIYTYDPDSGQLLGTEPNVVR